ncbi:hypothetical protein QN096_12370 [Metapseudomonas otitidis]|uniref:hypothetical protein n=1 Tax=Metapseudomonas otitidis TaxID=319939 RepID=UPI00253F9759|nr:hypothetical protein [Pseudomonas otitidis]WIF69892.1 hypothetical protein QN096_12370 [Pseudomonas otitidis]
MNYLFVPFTSQESNSELLSMGTLWASQVAKDPRSKESPRLLLYNTRQMKPLSIINNDDTLYVIAHGYDGVPDYIFGLSTPPATGNIPALTAGELAARLKVAGLNVNHRRVKLYVCNSGGDFSQFATSFKTLMRDSMGYPNIDVYYYNSSVSVPKEFTDGNYHKEGVLFDAQGRVVLTPRFRASEARQRVP